MRRRRSGRGSESGWPKRRTVAFIRSSEAEDHADGGRLAGAVGAERAEDSTARNGEIDAADGGDFAIALGQPAGLDDVFQEVAPMRVRF